MLKTERIAFETYQRQSAAKLKVQGQVADARDKSLSQAEKALQARQTSLAAMEARLNQKALDLAKGDWLACLCMAFQELHLPQCVPQMPSSKGGCLHAQT